MKIITNRVQYILFIFSFILIFFSLLMNTSFSSICFTDNNNTFNSNDPECSGAIWATLDLTNPGEINNSRFTHSSIIPIKGRLYNWITNDSKIGYAVAIEVDTVLYSGFNDITDLNGKFQIDYTIDPNLDIYTSHEITVRVTTDPTPGDVEYHHHYNIFVNTTSYFDLIPDDITIPKLTGEDFNLNGHLRYGNDNGISFGTVYYYWFEGATIINSGSFPTDLSGSLIGLPIPDTSASYLTLKLNYSDPPQVDYSEYVISNIKVFSDISWSNLVIDYSTTVGADYELTGTLFSLTDPALRINNREIEIVYNGAPISTRPATIITDNNGYFEAHFDVPPPNGTATIAVQLVNFAGKDISSGIEYILVDPAPPPNPGGGGWPPFFLFSVIFFSILAGIVAGLAVYGYKYYKKQEEDSRVVNIPLESKIRNLKILKDSGRLEESISYLFNAIYMDLINAKYNRTRKDNETIRDFAIVSVKELRLTPSSIYPFIQKVEEIIYAKPFKITEKDFYNTCELFSPIYFQLTGYNFILNF